MVNHPERFRISVARVRLHSTDATADEALAESLIDRRLYLRHVISRTRLGCKTRFMGGWVTIARILTDFLR
jgi:hypothetical protein